MTDMPSLLRAARTCRRFDESRPVAAQTLRDMVDAVRITSSCFNGQPLRYITVSSSAVRDKVFPHITWAAALKDWAGPELGERPTGYILLCSVREPGMYVYYDAAIAGQSLQLCATEMGLGCCMINNFAHAPLCEILDVPKDMAPLLLLAFGHPREERRIVDAKNGDKLAYWRNAEGVHHVPKLGLDQVLLAEK